MTDGKSSTERITNPKVSEELSFVSGPEGHRLALTRTRALSVEARSAILLIHGATFPSALATGYPMAGRSWAGDLAANGYDVWALDFVGFGRSPRYVEMDADNSTGVPLGDTDCAAAQVEAAGLKIAEECSARIHLVAHSWGNAPAARFASKRPELVESFVMFGPLVAERTVQALDAFTTSYMRVGLDQQWESFCEGVPDHAEAVISRSDFDVWGEQYLATDPRAFAADPPGVRVPFGPLAELFAAKTGSWLFDPAELTSPVLVVRGEWDVTCTDENARDLMAALASVPSKRYVIVPEGAHRLHLERSRNRLFGEVQRFIDEHSRSASARRS